MRSDATGKGTLGDTTGLAAPGGKEKIRVAARGRCPLAFPVRGDVPKSEFEVARSPCARMHRSRSSTGGAAPTRGPSSLREGPCAATHLPPRDGDTGHRHPAPARPHRPWRCLYAPLRAVRPRAPGAAGGETGHLPPTARNTPKNSDQRGSPSPGPSEVKTQGVSVRATRKPAKLNRRPVEYPRRLAERRSPGT